MKKKQKERKKERKKSKVILKDVNTPLTTGVSFYSGELLHKVPINQQHSRLAGDRNRARNTRCAGCRQPWGKYQILDL